MRPGFFNVSGVVVIEKENTCEGFHVVCFRYGGVRSSMVHVLINDRGDG